MFTFRSSVSLPPSTSLPPSLSLPSSFPDQVKSYVKEQCLSAIGDASALIRATVGLVISMIANRGEISNWPELLPSLCHFIEQDEQFICEVRVQQVYLFCLYHYVVVFLTNGCSFMMFDLFLQMNFLFLFPSLVLSLLYLILMSPLIFSIFLNLKVTTSFLSLSLPLLIL